MTGIKQLSAAIAGVVLGAQAHAASLDVDLNNDTLRAQYNFSAEQADVGISAAAMLTDDKGEVYYLTLRTQGALANQRNIRGGFGTRAYYASPDNGDSFQALALGGYLDVTVPEIPALSAGVELYYAPSITTTDDLDNVRELQFTIKYQLFENASAYVGIRHLEVEEGDFDFEFEDGGGHVGFTLEF